MKKEYIDKLNKEHDDGIQREVDNLIEKIEKCSNPLLTDDLKREVISMIRDIKKENDPYSYSYLRILNFLDCRPLSGIDGDLESSYVDWLENLGDIEKLLRSYSVKKIYDRYLDTPPMEFDGDIIITDPGYVIKDDDWNDFLDNHLWNQDVGKDDRYSYKGVNFIARDTLYGDWSCTVFDMETEDSIGEFCADAGLVAVFDLKEVLTYNPEFDYHIEKTWTTALIKDFKGTVEFIVEEDKGIYEDDSEYHKKGESWVDYNVKVVGHGINKKTGNPIDFVGCQTGL